MPPSSEQKKKEVKLRPIPRVKDAGPEDPWSVFDELIRSYPEPFGRFKDNNVEATKVKKTTDLERALYKDAEKAHASVQINKDIWNDNATTHELRLALMDHALTSIEFKKGSDGEPKYDELGNPIIRKRRPDFSGFKNTVARHGAYSEKMFEVMENYERRSMPLFADIEDDDDEEPDSAGQPEGAESEAEPAIAG